VTFYAELRRGPRNSSLSKTAVEKTTRRGLHADGGGLYLQIAANGPRSWLFRYSRNERKRHLGLGPTHAVDLDQVREKAREYRGLPYNGVDPLAHQNAQRAAAQLEAPLSAKIFGAPLFSALLIVPEKRPRNGAAWPLDRSDNDAHKEDSNSAPNENNRRQQNNCRDQITPFWNLHHRIPHR